MKKEITQNEIKQAETNLYSEQHTKKILEVERIEAQKKLLDIRNKN
jgi:hypothetical protein